MRPDSATLPILALLLAALAASGCSRKQPEPQPQQRAGGSRTARSGREAPAAWHCLVRGDVDAAFAEAKASGKPIFLYWGAEWCPPCAQIKSTIFNKREFQERSKLVRARVPRRRHAKRAAPRRALRRGRLSDHDPVPTDGTEITRLPGTVGHRALRDDPHVALADAKPVAEILKPQPVAASDCQRLRLLAYYSWASDNVACCRRPSA